VVLSIEGEAGVGKTTLWLEAVRRSRLKFFRTLSCRCVEAEAKLAFTALADLFAPVADDVVADLPPPQRRALEVALLQADPVRGSRVEQRAISLAVLGSLRLLAQVGPVAVAVDDLQWLDAPSARVLAFALRRLEDDRVGIVATLRPSENRPVELDQLAIDYEFERLVIGALEVDDLHRVFETHLGRTFPPPTLKRIHRTSRGNALFALELARTLLERGLGSAEEPLPLPEQLVGLLKGRLAALPADTRRALAAAAALPEPTPALVAAALGTRAGASPLRSALAAGVIELHKDRIRFTHPLLASIAYADLPPARRRRLHERLAAAVTSSEERAKHLGLAAEKPESRVAAALERAAHTAYMRGAPDEAAALAQGACRLTPARSSHAKYRRMVDLGWYHARSGDVARAREMFDEVIESAPSSPIRARAIHLLGRMQTHGDAATIELQERARVEAVGDDTLSVSIERVLARYWSRRDLKRAERHARNGVELANRLDDPLTRATALTTLAAVTFARGRGGSSAMLESALKLEPSWSDEGVYARPGVLVAEFEAARGNLGEACALYGRELRAAEARGDYLGVPELLLSLAYVESEGGAYAAAAEHARTAREEAARSDIPTMAALAVSALVDAHTDHVDAARKHAVDAIRQSEHAGSDLLGPLRSTFVTAKHALGLVELGLGNTSAAIEHLQPLVTRVAAAGAHHPALFRFVPDAIEALVALGEIDESRRLLALHEEHGLAVDDLWAFATTARCRGLLLAADGALADAAAALEQAVQRHQGVEMPFDLARTLLVKGTIERRAKRRREARSSLHSALDLFDRLGTPAWAEKTRVELQRIGGRTRPSGLTPTEERIALLVAQGKTNREVAQELFVAEKTVETTLSRVYRKLGVRSRSELAATHQRRAGGSPASKL
jgi:DNA-binding CsgD family transcriptional regulator